MKIAIVAGHFMPEIGYQEVYLARAFSKLDHEVCVFTSDRPSPLKKTLIKSSYTQGVTEDTFYGFKINRVSILLNLGAMLYSSKLKEEVLKFNPKIVIVIGVGKVFPLPVFMAHSCRKYKLVSLFGDNSDYYSWNSLIESLNSLKSIIVRKLIKNYLYAKAVNSSDRLIYYTNETESIVTSYLPRRLKGIAKEKGQSSTLGFDPDDFFFDETERYETRKKLSISSDKIVFITSTRVTKGKNLEKVVDKISNLYKIGMNVVYLIIGFSDNTYGEQLRNYINKKTHPNIIHCFPFLTHKEIRRLYNAADIGIWLNASISILEAMGTGLPLILKNKSSVNHLLHVGLNGWYYEEGGLSLLLEQRSRDLSKKNKKEMINNRKYIEQINIKRLSYLKISAEIIKEL